ncbi:MAG: MFS transporter [Pseudomonadota bacterium]
MTQDSTNAAVGSYRWRIPAVLGVTVLVAYLDRSNITLALPLIAQEFGWNDSELQTWGSLLFSMFYAGYGLSGLLLSPFASRLGPRKGIAIILLLASLFTAMGAFFSQFLLLFAASRVLLGIAEGPHFPLSGMAIKHWFPAGERARANSVLFAGIYLAIISGPLLLVPLMHTFGWRAAFLLLAAFGLLVSVPMVLRLVHDRPGLAPGISARESQWLESTLTEATTSGASLYPLYLLRQRDFTLLLLASILNNIVTIGLTSWLPTLFTVGRGVEYESLAWVAALPYVSGLIGLAFWSQLGDRLNARGMVAAAGYLLLAVSLYTALATESFALSLSAMALAVFCASAFSCAEYAFAQHIVPAGDIAAGIGLFNGLSIITGGLLGPLAASSLLEPGGGWSLWLLIALSGLCALTMAILGGLRRY